MDSKDLNTLMVPCFEKHPETKPREIVWNEQWKCFAMEGRTPHAPWQKEQLRLFDHLAVQLCESSLVRWLANTGDRKPLEIRIGSGGIDVRGPLQEQWSVAQTLLESLVSAALSIPGKQEGT